MIWFLKRIFSIFIPLAEYYIERDYQDGNVSILKLDMCGVFVCIYWYQSYNNART